MPPAEKPPVASTTHSAPCVTSRSPTFARTAVTRAPSRSAPVTVAFRITRPPARRSRSRSTANTRMPGTDGGSVGTSNTGRASRSCSSGHAAPAMPSTAGNATRSSAPNRPLSWPATSARNAGSSNPRANPSEFTSARRSGTRSSSTDRAVIPARERLSASSGAMEVLQRPEAHHAHVAAVAEIARRHRLGHHGGRLQRPHRGRQQQVLVQAAHVREPLLEPLDRRRHAVASDRRVRVILAQPGERLARALDPLRRVAEHVDRARAEMGGADALGEHEHTRAALRHPHGGGQAGEADADHDRVVHGTCSTSSSPWKIQSSSRAWRSWSPYRIGHTPFHRSCRNRRSDSEACSPSSRPTPCRIPVAR